MTRRRPSGTQDGRRSGIVVASGLVALSVVLLAACSSPSKAAKNGSAPSSTTTTTKVSAAACSPSSVSAAVDYTTFGGSSTSPAGAVLFTDTSNAPCSLRGIPKVQLVGSDGAVIQSTMAPSHPADPATAVLTPAGSGTANQAASSITWSSLTCLAGSFSLTIQFPGWSTSVPAGSTSGYSGPACAATGGTVYVSPVEPVTAPSTTSTTAPAA